MEHALDNGSMNNGMRHGNLAQAWLVLLLAACFGAALAAVQIHLSDAIAANKRNETFSQIPSLVLGPGRGEAVADPKERIEIIPGTVTVETGGHVISYPVYRVNLEGRLSGWVVKASGPGYSGNIELLLGLDPSAQTITGLFILEQKETPGLGNKITFTDWRNQFVGQKTDRPLSLKKIGGPGLSSDTPGVDAISGATISSRAVTGIVNKIVGHVKGNLTPEKSRTVERKM